MVWLYGNGSIKRATLIGSCRYTSQKNNYCSINLTLRLDGAIYRLRFYSNSLIHILSLSNSHNNVGPLQTNRENKSGLSNQASHHPAWFSRVFAHLFTWFLRVFFRSPFHTFPGCNTAGSPDLRNHTLKVRLKQFLIR